jgi:soluble lytic murein transglycosylase-like protein
VSTFALLVLGVCRLAEAQIYSWHDAKGTLVLSDRPLGSVAPTFAVPRAQTVVTTRRVNNPRHDYDDIIIQHASTHGVRPDLVRAVIQVESAFDPYATSRKGAMGLMQLMPSTLADFRVLNPFNVVENIRAGVAYLRQLLTRYGENEELALAAYNAGPAAVQRYGNVVPPYRETRTYVRTVTNVASTPTHHRIYKTVEIVDGHPVPRYSDTKPPSGAFELVSQR